MAKEKTNKEKLLQEAERNLHALENNPRKLSLAAFALRQINRVDPREMNVVFTDKEFLKTKLEQIQEMDGIYTKLMANIGKDGFLEDLKEFEKHIEAIETAMNTLIDTFYAKNIGHGSAIQAWKKKQEAGNETEEKTEESK